MSTSAPLRPDPDAEAMAEQMVRADHTMHTILEETVTPTSDGIMESGRTACGGLVDVTGPMERFPRAVDLNECPRGLAGTWHSHVTQDQLLDPEHSLPDMANVVFGHTDVSVVVGASTSDVLVAADDRGAMADTYRNVLGLEVESTRDVVEALDDGRLSNPPAVRSRVRAAFGDLFRTYDTSFPEIQSEVYELTSEGAITARSPDAGVEVMEPMYALAYLTQGMHEGKRRHPARVRDQARRVNSQMHPLGHYLAERAVGSAVGMAVRRGVRALLF